MQGTTSGDNIREKVRNRQKNDITVNKQQNCKRAFQLRRLDAETRAEPFTKAFLHKTL